MGALQLPLSGLELVMFGSYQFKPPFPLQRCGSWIESYLGDLQSLDGTGRGGLRAPTHSSHHAPAPPFPPPPRDAPQLPARTLGLTPVPRWAPGWCMGLITGKAETSPQGTPNLKKTWP